MQYGVNKQSHIFDSLCASDRRFTQFVIKPSSWFFYRGIHFTKHFDVISKQKAF